MHFRNVERQYDQLARYGAYGTLAPSNRGGYKAQYIAEVFDAALLPTLIDAGPYKQLLDFGCGTGIFMRKSATIGSMMIGIDLSESMLAAARSVCSGANNAAFVKVDGERIPFADHSFDRVIARESLCYIPEEKLGNVLNEIRRVLEPGGLFLVLDQTSDKREWQKHVTAPNLIKRSPNALRESLLAAELIVEDERVIRAPRFPWIYPIWLGLVPKRYFCALARAEVAWHRHSRFLAGNNWRNTLFLARKPIRG